MILLTGEQVEEHRAKFMAFAEAMGLDDTPHLMHRGEAHWFESLRHAIADLGEQPDPGPCETCGKQMHPSPFHPSGWVCFWHSRIEVRVQ